MACTTTGIHTDHTFQALPGIVYFLAIKSTMHYQQIDGVLQAAP
jgi:hypothetical protein